MSSFIADLRYAARSLKRSRGFVLLAVTTLAVGIGSTTALFTLVDAVLLRPLPFKEPHRLVEIWGRTGDRTGMRVPGVILEALRSRAKTLAVIGTHDPSGGVLNTAEGAIDIRGQTVSANFVDVFGVQPLVGRGFVPEDEQAGAPAVMLASFSFWQQYLGADAGAVGRTCTSTACPTRWSGSCRASSGRNLLTDDGCSGRLMREAARGCGNGSSDTRWSLGSRPAPAWIRRGRKSRRLPPASRLKDGEQPDGASAWSRCGMKW